MQTSSANQTITLTFTGTWAGFGYLAAANAGQVEMLLDSVSQGTLDTYARSSTPQSVYFSGLTPATHTLTLRVTGTRHPYSSDNRFHFDYFDVWDGTSIPDGTSETPFARTWNWAEDSGYGGASGGTFYRDGTAMWHAFTGASVTYQAIANATGGEVELRVDGQVQAYLDLKSSATTTRTLSLGSLGTGPHVLQVRAYRGAARVDAFTTPGSPPYYQLVRSGVIRYEEDDATIRYGGMSYVQMPQVWNVVNDNYMASDGYYVWSETANQTVTLTFTGTWAGFGYLAAANAGQVEMLLDDISQGTLDTYASANTPRSVYFKDLTPGAHTLTLRVTGTHGPGSSGNRFDFDYFDVWDGTQTPEGTSETPFARTWNWTEDSGYGGASGGTYYRDGTAMWYAFTGDLVTYQAVATSWAGQVEVSIDGITRSVVSLYNPTTITRTFEYTQVGIGPHVLQVRLASGRATVDAFLTPPAVRPVADFTAAPLVGTAPLTVTFTNQSVPTRTIISYLWDFGDGVTSTLQHPVHAYTDLGAYTVRLTANTERHSDTETKVGYVTVVPTSAVVITYTYDGLYRLTNATYSGAATATFDYAYDAAGNRTAMTKTITSTLVTTHTYDAANRLATQNGQSLFTWDANGNLLNDGSATYAYDFANRLISTTLGGATTQFGYNGEGIRLRLIEAGTLTTYTQDYAAPLPVVLQAKTGTASTQYVYSLGTRPIGEYEAAAWEYLLADPLGSVRQIADPSGNVTLLKSYEPYGNALNSQGSAISIFAYAGEQIDATGLVFLRARYMQPRLGAFLSRDVWEGDMLRPGSMNGWNYVEGNPILLTDPSGYEPPRPIVPPDLGLGAFAMNGYLEGVSLATTLFGQYIEFRGYEIVYDFVTHERMRFSYEGYWEDPWCGTNTNLLADVTTSVYAGFYNFQDRGIEKEYRGGFFNFSSSLTPPQLSAILGKIAPKISELNAGGTEGWTAFCATGDSHILEIPGIRYPAQCGFSIFTGVSASGGGPTPFGAGTYFTYFTPVDGTHQPYSSLEDMVNDISIGWNAPWWAFFLNAARQEAVKIAKWIWEWQDGND